MTSRAPMRMVRSVASSAAISCSTSGSYVFTSSPLASVSPRTIMGRMSEPPFATAAYAFRIWSGVTAITFCPIPAWASSPVKTPDRPC